VPVHLTVLEQMQEENMDTAAAKTVADNWSQVCESVEAACATAGRSPESVQAVGVSKYVDAATTDLLFKAGCQILGENRPQLIWEKAEYFAASQPCPTWHMIGHFQRNKVRRTLPHIAFLHSLDNLKLAEVVSQEATKIDRTLKTLVEVNVTQDDSKTGLPAAQVSEFLGQLAEMPGMEICGLMAMSSHHADCNQVQSEFGMVRELRDKLQTEFPNLDLKELSMGMSNDYIMAIAEGATMVRIGSSLWKGII